MIPDGTRVLIGSNDDADVSNYKRLRIMPISGTAANTTETVTSAGGEVLIISYISDPLGITNLPAGGWSIIPNAYVSTADGITTIKAYVYIRNLAGTEAELFNATSAEIDSLTAALHTISHTESGATPINSTDRLVVKLYGITNQTTLSVTVSTLGSPNQTKIILPCDISSNDYMPKLVYDSDGNGVLSGSGSGMTNPMTAAGDMIVGGSSGTPGNLAIGDSGQYLKIVAGTPTWATDTEPLGGFESRYLFCDDVIFGGTTPVWHELETKSDGGAVGTHTATTTSYTELDRYVTAALNTTVIPEGTWVFTLFCKIAGATLTGQIKADVYRVNSSGTIVGSVLGTAESAAFGNTITVGITCMVYISEKTGWSATDRIGVVLSGKKVGAPAGTLTFYHDIASGWASSMQTPIVLLHNQLSGLNDGDYVHLTAAEYSSLGGSFGGYDYICVMDVKTSGTHGGGFNNGSYQTRDINTEQSDSGGHCTISSNQIRLDAGTYRAHIFCPAYRVNHHRARLYNVTGTAELLKGTSALAYSDFYLTNHSIIEGKFTLSVQSYIEVQHICQTTIATNGFGEATSLDDEVYTVAEFWKE